MSVSEVPSLVLDDPFVDPVDERFREALHDMRQPLAAVFALAECARSTPGLPPEAGWYLDQLIEQVDETARMARSALEHSRAAPPSGVLCFDAVLSSALESFALTWRGRLLRRGDQGSVPVRGQEETLRRCLVNLLENATYAAGPEGTVLVTVDRRPDQVRVVIEDDGPGFGRVVPRTGLGLRATQRALAPLGGSVSVEQRNGLDGACVVLSLPVVPVADAVPAC